MRVGGRVLVSVGWAMFFALFSNALDAQSALWPALREPFSVQTTDGVPLYSTPAATSEGVLQDMASRAAVIFVGKVTAIQMPSDDTMRDSAAGAVIEVDFAVERSVCGATAGAQYAMREWAGMWRDSPRFAVGQRLLMLLHAPGPGGLSSPVDGLDGAIPVRGGGAPATGAQGVAPLSVQAIQATDTTVSVDTVDMRWLQARAIKLQTFADAPVGGPGVTIAGGLTGGPVVAVDSTVSTLQGSTLDHAVQAPMNDGLAHVLGLLAAWHATMQTTAQGTRSASN